MKNKSSIIACVLLTGFISSTPAHSNPFWELMTGRNLLKYLVSYPIMPDPHDATLRVPMATYLSAMPQRPISFYFGVHLKIEYGQPISCSVPPLQPWKKIFALTLSIETDRNSMYSLTLTNERHDSV